MKLTKAKQKQLDQAYDTLIQVCLYDRPLKDMEPFLADDVMNFGAGRKELTKTKAAFLKQIKNQKKLASGLKMDFQINPVLRKITNKGDGAIYTDDIVNTVLVNGVKNKLKFRLSFIFEYRDRKWIMLHSHTSTPDSQRSDDEVWPVEELKKRTAVLEKSLDEKIAELEIKNRELEIEAALERVRARTMAMHKSDELREAVRVIYEQLQHLGFDSNACNIIIIDKESGDMQYWVSGFTQEIFPEGYYVPYLSHPYHEELLAASRQNKKYDVMEYSGEMKISFDNIFFTQTDFRKIPEEAKTFMKALKSVKLSTAFFTYGALQVLSHAELTGERVKILERFAQVFDLTYTRFLDLQKAEAQAREATIEMLLERVRARSMAMHHSSDLQEVIKIVADQFVALKLKFDSASFGKVLPDGSWDLWIATPDQPYPAQVYFPYFDHKAFKHVNELFAKKIDFSTDQFTYKEKNSFFQYFFEHTAAKNIPEERKQYVLKGEGFVRSIFILKNIMFTVAKYEVVPFTDEENAVFKRFANVFEQAYTRFLDLQKAEAQARESQIEAALERVRSRTMAMHRSEEIADILGKMFEELKRLDMVLVRVLIWIFNHEEKYISWWSANTEVESTANSYRVDYNEHPVFLAVLEAWQKKVPLKLYTLSGAEKDSWQDHLFNNTGLSKLPDMVQKGMRSEGTIFTTSAISDYGLLMSGSLEPLSDENTDIIQRFGRVFQQSYTRYIDVQKAEEQAREARIQLALERVRARAMAMQTSEELNALIGTVFTELTKLDLVLVGCDIIIFDSQTNSSQWWMVNSEAPTEPLSFFIKYHQHPPYLAFIDAWKQRKLRWVYELKGNTKKEWDDFLFNETELSLVPSQVIANMKGLESVLLSSSFNNFGCLNIGTRERLSEEHFDILLRFAKVFDLTYTRFNDLKHAEAQAKEAKIQLALERVRARTMAMQKSDELMEAAHLLFMQVQSLGIPVWACGYNIWEKGEKVCIGWMSVQGAIQPSFRIPLTEHRTFIHMYESRLKAEPFYVEEVSGEELADHYRYMFSLPDFREIVMKQLQGSDFPLPLSQINHVFNFKHGNLIFLSAEAIPEAWDIFKRFTAVFEQTYTRFLDLQKAEAQAREAQIEAALEKVRSRSLAMHTANELGEVVTVIVEKLKDLGVVLDANGVVLCTYFQNSKDVLHWIVSPDYSMAGSYLLPYFDHPIFNAAWQSKENGEEYFSRAFSIVEKNSFFEHAFEHSDYRYFPDEFKQWIFQNDQHILSFAWQKNSAILIPSHTGVLPSEEDIAILKRFAKVFEQSYVRFLDLQKAEAQAREAQIEAALERVRSRSMAMHKSDELLDIIIVVSEQLQQLNIKFGNVSFGVNNQNYDLQLWMAVKGYPLAYHIHWTFLDNPGVTRLKEAQQQPEKVYADVLTQAENNEWLQHIFNCNPALDIFSDDARNKLLNSPGYARSIAAMKDIFIVMGNYAAIPYTDDENAILKRFANVFEQAYKRFLDLQKAETQAREAQIEAALERVRSRSMAMHKSDELAKVASVMFEEIRILGGELWSAGLVLCEKDKPVMEQWMSMTTLGLLPPFHIPVDLDKFHRSMYEAWKTGVELYTEEFTETEIKRRHELLMGIPDVREAFDKIREAGIQAPKWQKNYVAPFKNGVLFIIVTGPFGDEKIFPRFARVFEQTYTRFLDLKKAEVQAREAQIEASLERVRASAMAMHRSDELSDVLAILFDQFDVLKIQPVDVHLDLFDLGKNTFSYRATGKEGKRVIAEQIVDLDSRPEWQALLQKWENGKPNTVDFSFYPKEVIKELMAFFPDIWAAMPEDAIMSPEDFPDGIFDALGYCKFGYIGFHHHRKATEEEQRILIRFANEFERLYQRFLDLQKAEAQSREAQIELGLERVRARAMAMQRSDELKELIATVSAELGKLDLVLDRCFIHTYDNKSSGSTWWMANPETPAEGIGLFVKYHEHSPYLAYLDAWHNRAVKWQYILEGTVKKTWDEFLFVETELSRLPRLVIENMRAKEKVYLTASFNNFGCLTLATLEPLSDEQFDIMLRFAKVFDLTYTRFNDLQKAEAQAREAQIELGLERVRARAMAMQKSEELKELIGTVFIELTKLDIVLTRCLIMIYDTVSNDSVWWMANSEAPADPIGLHIKYHEHAPYVAYINAWREKNLKWTYVLEGADKKSWDDFLFAETELSHLPGFVIDGMKAPNRVYLNSSFNTFGNLTLASLDPLSNEHFDILLRFAKVFDLTYTRFNDLQKAEAQAREAKIEAALERVRSRTMAMHKSDELLEVISVVSGQLQQLNFKFDNVSFGENNADYDIKFWMSIKARPRPILCHAPYVDNPIINRVKEAQKKGRGYLFSDILTREENQQWIHHLYNNADVNFPEEIKNYLLNSPGYSRTVIILNNIFFFIGNYSAIRYTDEENSIFSRFGNVFEQSYTRFLDLQKAEAQAREAQIETALERVRSRSLAMHRSDELQEVVNTVFERLQELEIDMNSANIAIFKEDSKDLNYWIASPVQNRSASFHLPYFDLSIIKDLFIAREDGKDFFSKSYSFDEKNEWFAHAFSHSDFQFLTEDRKQFIFGTDAYTLAIAMAKNTGVQVNRYSSKPFSEAEVEILKRFSRVFEQAYIRFLDLQKAENQAREALIETSLERVRSKAMAMQKPNELIEVAELLRKEMGLLGVEELETSSIYIHNEASGKTECWFAIKDGQHEKNLIADHMTIDLTETGVGRQMMDFYRSDKKQISIAMQGTNRKEWINYCADHAKVFGSSGFYGDNIPDRTYHLYKFSNGYMGAASPGDISAESWGLLQRATTVFSLAYTRFNDLQQAETSAREAVKQAALDRVRAEIASMRTISDLDRITPLIWNELNILGISFIRCGVFIMDESQKLIHTFLSSPDGKAIAAFHLPYDTPGNFPDVIDHWRNKKIYVRRWSEDDFLGIANTLVRQGAIATKEQYLGTLPKGGFYLHFLPFLQGLLYVGNTDQLGEEEIILIQHVADAFSTAYARYEDFNKLEAAKQQVDKTLTDLKQAQTQLVQSEKMASLGELTAGIAHEIQNPLNFVNNFSDVSNELLDEMKGELATGNLQQAIEIAQDVKQNLEKILHHGKRADAIVKGMLQHSRASSGQKEPTDINILVDEYLRLAYHGLRAKDKSFNAKFETIFDDRIGKINIIPQEMGRVILNLINNGFYAVSEKKKAPPPPKGGIMYEPMVVISTSKDDGKVEIKVRDNGIGIPQKMLDKIFQPFFTTKPTGEGTGLGLSLAYDIVKAHGGELKVETSEGEGSEFIIQLPVV